jgi:hypothetical protein
MARSKNVNKSQAIRDFLGENPDAKPKAIMAALKSQGISVSSNMCSIIRARRRVGYPKGKGSKKKQPDILTVPAIMAFRTAVSEVGGYENMKMMMELFKPI